MKFPSKHYLCCPKITFKVEPDDIEPVSLHCIVPIDKKIRQWKNVTYEIEWFVDGKKAYTERPFCRPLGGQTKNKDSCPGDKEIRSLLTPDRYEPGQWVSGHVSNVVKPLKGAPLTGAQTPLPPKKKKLRNKQKTEILREPSKIYLTRII